jgi:hypothetical protein
MTERRRRTSPTSRRRLLGGYFPLAVGVAAVIAMITVVPSRIPDEIAGASGGSASEVPVGQAASGWGSTVTPCADRELQVPDAGYSPPCFEFSGDNGGATSEGVTADTIKISYRNTAEGNVLGLFAQLSGMPIEESTEDLARTAEGLIDYFNQNYQLYGRRLELVGYQGRGQMLQELFGGGQEGAANDALQASDEIGAFADVTALTQPYADALSRQGVVNFGAPYMSREWFEERRPYAWTPTPDCSAVAENSTEYANEKLLNRPAEFAGGDLQGETRRIAVIAPNNLEYQQCVSTGLQVIEDAGNRIDLELEYVLDFATVASQAPSLLARLRDADITSVACYCDPLMVLSLAGEATQQDYFPEWLIGGVGFLDLDIVGQFIASSGEGQWEHAFGGSPSTPQQPAGQSEAYRAYTSVRDDEPSLFVDVVYLQLLPLVLGVQMAGPDLTPENLETGMFAFPERTGVAGTWDWGPGHYSPVRDIREIWWDPDAISPFNGQPGSYVDNGQRYRTGEIPAGDPEVFQ